MCWAVAKKSDYSWFFVEPPYQVNFQFGLIQRNLVDPCHKSTLPGAAMFYGSFQRW